MTPIDLNNLRGTNAAKADPQGKQPGNTRLSQLDVIAVLHFHALGFNNEEIAEWLGVTPVHVGRIVSGKSWKTLTLHIRQLVEYHGVYIRPDGKRRRRWARKPEEENLP